MAFGRRKKYYYNTATGEVEEGKRSGWENRMGPYATREEAEGALERARQNTARHDELDRAEGDRDDEDDGER